MQTFLPFPSFEQSVKALDYRRLGKQRVETKQILMSLLGESTGWSNHPATKMWAGHEFALAEYGLACCNEWRARGYKDTLLYYFVAKLQQLSKQPNTKPRWFGWHNFHVAHQSNLIRKNADFYSPKFPGVKNDLPYLWSLDAKQTS